MIRIRHPQGVTTLSTDPSMTLDELRALIFSSTDIPPEEQDVKSGFPPKSMPDVPGSTQLSDSRVNIRKGDQLIIARLSSAPKAPASASSVVVPTSFSTGARSALPSNLTAPQTSGSSMSSASSTRLPSVSMDPKGKVEDGSAFRIVDGSYLTLKVVPDDNSCLFNSIGCLMKRKSDAQTCMELRRVISDFIRADPIEFSEVILGYEPETYIKKILSPDTWGGAIELRIFSEHFQVEINSVDIATGRVDRYGEERAYAQKIFVVYSGIHYDALLVLPMPDAPLEFATTTFDEDQAARVRPGVLELVAELKKRKYYTDTATFTLLCKQCGAKLVGEKGIAEHSTSTGHSDFQEYTAD